MRRWAIIFVFIIGFGLGLSGPILAPRYLGPYLPQFVQGKTEDVKGKVEQKQMEEEGLLITVSTDQGAILAKFKQKVAEINLLVKEGDTITLRLKGYEPFVNDPTVVKVEKRKTSPLPSSNETMPSSNQNESF
ncbi:MAG TPA: hypothetical protein VGB26_12955 [Nitrospiria bacterium]|jgi:hypothetical protein